MAAGWLPTQGAEKIIHFLPPRGDQVGGCDPGFTPGILGRRGVDSGVSDLKELAWVAEVGNGDDSLWWQLSSASGVL